ncbi:ATP-binding protein [Roseiterribacter gracilis]|uniref:histidine kinase n=1 Tax=Roseiterribacter gracilis TaxID=2812848 RepID=A0A8S8XLL7_9PROT|nr:sensory/regulatory protein RpfC [Rhodospirillales bacterium TMPK1]
MLRLVFFGGVVASAGFIILGFVHGAQMPNPPWFWSWVAALTILPLATARRLRAGLLLDRPADVEHEQAAIRIVALAVVALAYLFSIWSAGLRPELANVGWLGGAHITMAWVMLIVLAGRPPVSNLRRAFANGFDVAILSAYLAIGAPYTAVCYAMYLWVSLGAGLRYGVAHLASTALIAFVGFSIAVAVNPTWRADPWLLAGLLIALIIVPAYGGLLIRRTNQARAEAEHASRAKSRFLAKVSHELRTPLSTIVSGATTLIQERDGPARIELARTIRTAANSMLESVGDLLDAARADARAFEIRVRDVDLARELVAVARPAAKAARDRGLTFSVILDADTPRYLQTDPARLRQVLGSLLENAVKFTDSGSVKLLVSSDPTHLLLRVQDTGPGIPEHAQARVFEPFRQADESIGARFGGVGLGLFVARHLTEALNGSLTVTSAVGFGATFLLSLPLLSVAEVPPVDSVHFEVELDFIRVQRPAPMQAVIDAAGLATYEIHGPAAESWIAAFIGAMRDASADAVLPGTAGVRVLLVDDNATNRDLVARMLRSLTYLVVEAEDGREALKVLSDHTAVDVALLDLRMPGISGIEVARRARAAGLQTKLIALTADAVPETREAAIAVGFETLLTKPTDPAALRNAIEAVVTQIGEVDAERLAVLKAIAPDDPAFLLRLVDRFEEDAQRALVKARRGLEEADLVAIATQAHALASVARQLGAPRLADLVDEAEQWTPADLHDRTPAVLEEAAARVRRTCLSLRASSKRPEGARTDLRLVSRPIRDGVN